MDYCLRRCFSGAGRTIIAAALLLAAASAASAQGELGTITGTLTDAQGGVLPGATATVINLDTNVKTAVVSNQSGVYVLSSLVNGRYRLTCALDGFAPIVRELDLRAGDRLRVDLTLSVGGLTEETRVVAETPLLETTTATRSQVIDKEKVENLPLAGRNPYALAYTIQGVTTQFTRPSISARPFDNGGMDAIAINGGRNRSNELLLDGAPNTSREGTSQGSLAFVPSPDAVQEVRVSTNTYDAQFGRTGGGVIAVSIRSGTNALRGTAYYNHRDASLNSNLYENTVRGIPKEDLFHYNPGFSIGGPVVLPKYNGRNRTFFFYSFEGLKSGIPVSAGERAPTDLERSGNFSQSAMTIYDPFNTINGVPQPFPGNIIPQNRMDPVALNLLEYMVAPNSSPDASGNNFFPRGNSRFDTYTSGITRIDHNFSDNHRFFFRYGHNGRRETRAKGGREEVATDGRLPSPVEQRAQRRPDVDAAADAALEPACRVDAAPPPRHQRRRRSRRLRSGDPRLSRVVRQRDPAAVRADPDQRLQRRVHRSGRRAGRAERRLLPAGDGHQAARPPSAEVRRRVPLRHQRRRESAGGHELRRLTASRATSPRCGRASARSPWPTAATPSRRSSSATWRRTRPRAARSSTGAAITAACSCRTTGGSRAT